ncbi:MAG: glycoside hydrolase family 2 protein, partial [Flavobacteriales bacterium]
MEIDCLNNGQHWSRSQQVNDSAWVLEHAAEISSPVLWWSNGLGNPNMTEFNCKIFFNDVVIHDKIHKTGLRELHLKTKDSLGSKSFHFELNGAPIFSKGANYIPLNYFPVDSDRDDYVNFLMACRNANINMIRVWGGGYYEDDAFYDLCDEYGIMVWHDFMFACSMYPGEKSFVANVRAEAIEQVKRLRNHPCMALWCGNNEVSEGWQRWGWKDGLSAASQDSLDVAYTKIFLDVLPDIVSNYSTISYHPSSPLFGRGDTLSQSEGDMHDWGVWHDELPLEELSQRIPRFMSEYGVQSFPSAEVLQMMSKLPLSESDSIAMNHQRHPRGFRLMRYYAKRWYPNVSDMDFLKYGYITQAVQAEGVINAINRH